jgi:hypothetical protein
MRGTRAARLLAGSGVVASVVLLASASCSDVTELVVVVDSDLRAGAEIDTVDVQVDGPAGFEAEPRRAAVTGASSLPVTLGIAAGSDPTAAVTVTAVATLGGKEVARTVGRGRMTAGTRRLLHVSLCRSCGLSCTFDVGDEPLPAWSGGPPDHHACDGPAFTDAGPDGIAPVPTGDGGVDAAPPPADAGEDAPSNGPCGPGCPVTATCDDFGCRVMTEPTCGSEIVVPAATMTFHGGVCPGKGANIDVCYGGEPPVLPAHVFRLGGSGTVDALVAVTGNGVKLNVVSSSQCKAGATNCSTLGAPADTNYAGCSSYTVKFTRP